MNATSPNKPFCAELVEYRDNQLFKSYSKAYDRIKIFSDRKLDLEKHKAQVMDDRNWIGSTGMEAFMQLVVVVKTTANLIEDLLQFAPAAKGVSVALKTYKVIKATQSVGQAYNSVEKLYNSVEKSKNIPKEEVALTIYKVIKATKSVGQLNNIVEKSTSFPQAVKAIKALSALKNFADNIMLFDTISKDSKAFRNDLNRLYNEADHELSIIITKLHNAETDREEVEKIKQGIDLYLAENCSKNSNKPLLLA